MKQLFVISGRRLSDDDLSINPKGDEYNHAIINHTTTCSQGAQDTFSYSPFVTVPDPGGLFFVEVCGGVYLLGGRFGETLSGDRGSV